MHTPDQNASPPIIGERAHFAIHWFRTITRIFIRAGDANAIGEVETTEFSMHEWTVF